MWWNFPPHPRHGFASQIYWFDEFHSQCLPPFLQVASYEQKWKKSWQPLGPLPRVKLLVGYMKNPTKLKGAPAMRSMSVRPVGVTRHRIRENLKVYGGIELNQGETQRS